jgi:hypothetical protein
MKKLTAILVLITTCFVTRSQGQCGTTNIALNKTVTYSSTDAIHTAARIVDGNSTTDWWPAGGSSGSEDQWLAVDLGTNYNVCLVAVDFQDNTHQAADYKIQTSTNGTTWADQVTITGNTTVNISHTLSVSARYVKIAMTKKAVVWSAYSVMELKVYNTTNQSPTVSVTSPANSASFTAGGNITINANATDADGTISKVEFYQGANKLGEDLVSPYSLIWNTVAAGNYSLTAVATDNGTASTTSSVVSITVSNPPAGSADWSLTGNAATTPGTNFLGTTDNQRLVFKTVNTERMTVLGSGYVGINTATPSSELTVNGVITTKKIKVTQLGWADYVFEKDYKLMNLKELEAYIHRFKHLPGVPSAAKVAEQGIDVGDAQATLLKKIEELTLYVIEQNKKLNKQQQQLKQQQEAIKALKKKIADKK